MSDFMQNLFGSLRRKLSKPVLFGVYGALGCLIAALFLGEPLLWLTRLPPSVPTPVSQAIALVIDCSGSMNNENRIGEAKSAATRFVQRQNLEQNQIAVLGFGSNVHLGSSLTSDEKTLEAAIATLQDGGGTDMGSAIGAADTVLKNSPLKRSILLFTDGVPDSTFMTSLAAKTSRFQGTQLIAVATGGADRDFLADVTGDPALVFYANSGQFEQAFQAAEKALTPQLVESESGDYRWDYAALRTGGWTGTLALGTALALIMGQNSYLRRRGLLSVREGTVSAIGGFLAGVLAGAVGYILFVPLAQVLPFLAGIGKVMGWVILGGLVGRGMALFVPNLQPKRAMLGGAIGGAAGAIGFLSAAALLGDIVGRAVGAAILGFFIGLMIAWIERLSRKAWLVVCYDNSPKEKSEISLGRKAIRLGYASDADIYLRKDQGYSKTTATLYTEGEQIFLQFDPEYKKLPRQELKPGDRRKFGAVMVEVKTSDIREMNRKNKQ
jgi:Ca-activated chloride channel homolog